MSYYYKNIRPGAESESESEEEVNWEKLLRKRSDESEADESNDDELRTLSFGSLKKAEAMIEQEDAKQLNQAKAATKPGLSKLKLKPQTESQSQSKSKSKFESESESQSQSKFKSKFESESESQSEANSTDSEFFEVDKEESSNKSKKKMKSKRGKHAPTEQSAKKRVSKVREIPGLRTSKNQNPNLYQDIRFDKSTGGPTDSTVIRRRYGFLDEYRKKEINEMESLLKDRKLISKMPQHELEELEHTLKSTKSRLQTMKNKDLERKIVKDYESELNKDHKNKFHLKQSERRKVVQKWKFDHMKAKQREKTMERKRKKRLGKEFRQFEFHK